MSKTQQGAAVRVTRTDEYVHGAEGCTTRQQFKAWIGNDLLGHGAFNDLSTLEVWVRHRFHVVAFVYEWQAQPLAKAMNERKLPAGVDGGQWAPAVAGHDDCEKCSRSMEWPEMCLISDIGGGVQYLCLPCALEECKAAQS